MLSCLNRNHYNPRILHSALRLQQRLRVCEISSIFVRSYERLFTSIHYIICYELMVKFAPFGRSDRRTTMQITKISSIPNSSAAYITLSAQSSTLRTLYQRAPFIRRESGVSTEQCLAFGNPKPSLFFKSAIKRTAISRETQTASTS